MENNYLRVSRATIADLNPHCFWEIFKYLQVRDVFSVMNAFDSPVDKIAYDWLTSLKHFDLIIVHDSDYTVEQLKFIGQYIRSLRVSSKSHLHPYKGLKFLQPLCLSAVGNSLKEICLQCIPLSMDYLECLSQIAPQLLKLEINCCILQNKMLEKLLRKCTKLVELSISGVSTLNGDFLNAIDGSGLKNLNIEITEINFDYKGFARLNPSMCITIYACGFEIYKQIGKF